MLTKDVEKRISLTEVLRSPALFPYLRQLTKERDQELISVHPSKLPPPPAPAEPVEPQSRISITGEAAHGGRLTLWNPLEAVDDTWEYELMKIKYSLNDESQCPRISEEPPRRQRTSDFNPFDFEPCDPSPLESLYTQCASRLGPSLFRRVYDYLKTQRSQNIDDDLVFSTQILDGLSTFVPEELLMACYDVDRLIYWEEKVR